jgi:hypothetical protein
MLSALLLAAAPAAISSKTDLLDFNYAWSAEANAVWALSRRFQADAARQEAMGLKTARAGREARRAIGGAQRDWTGHMFSRSWTTAGFTAEIALARDGDWRVHPGRA